MHEKKEKKRIRKYTIQRNSATTPSRKSRAARGVQNSGREDVARNSGKNPPMQKYVQEGGQKGGGTREPSRRGRLTRMASGV